MIAERGESYRNHGSQAEFAKLTILRGRTPETQSPSGKAFATLSPNSIAPFHRLPVNGPGSPSHGERHRS